jgi:AbiV family abortive infection protein
MADTHDVDLTHAHAISMEDVMLLRRLCLQQARGLIASAERIVGNDGFPHIAYHLAVLALEEVGKAGMIASRAVIGNARDMEWMEKRFEHHIFKIQWAIWSPSLNSGRIDPNAFEEARRVAQSTHARRISGLYVNQNADAADLVPPSAAVTAAQATAVLNLARARLDLESVYEVSGGPNEELKWCLDTMNDEVGQRRLTSQPFLDKHYELNGDTRAWVVWPAKSLKTSLPRNALIFKGSLRGCRAPRPLAGPSGPSKFGSLHHLTQSAQKSSTYGLSGSVGQSSALLELRNN